MKKKIIVIGAGIAGISAATSLAAKGHDVTILEKNDSPGGRARKYEADGFVFDMGPSWYWMPDVFERYFQQHCKSVKDFYQLKRLDPSYRVYFEKDDFADVPAGVHALSNFFESLEPGSSKALKKFLEEGEYKYSLGMGSLVYKPGLSLTELADSRVLRGMLKLHIFQSLSRYVRKFFRHPKLISILEFPVLFLGAAPSKTPALYSLMNYADMALGTWYPMGGMFKIIEAMVALAEEKGVKFLYNTPVTKIEAAGRVVTGVRSSSEFFPADFVVAGADYHHVEQELLPAQSKQYDSDYWDSRVMAPSCLIFYLGVNKRIGKLLHHNLFFDEDIDTHIDEIYGDPRWPSKPQFYVCCPSKTDDTVAPEGHENLFVLIPVAPGLPDTEKIRDRYFQLILDRLEKICGETIRENIVYKRSYAHNDFMEDYHAFKGNAYGLANTLTQTANLKPAIANKKLDNLFYTGQLTVPGPGMPPSLISGQVTAEALEKTLRSKKVKQNQESPVITQ